MPDTGCQFLEERHDNTAVTLSCRVALGSPSVSQRREVAELASWQSRDHGQRRSPSVVLRHARRLCQLGGQVASLGVSRGTQLRERIALLKSGGGGSHFVPESAG